MVVWHPTCVAMPAWSVPGSHKVFLPAMRAYLHSTDGGGGLKLPPKESKWASLHSGNSVSVLMLLPCILPD